MQRHMPAQPRIDDAFAFAVDEGFGRISSLSVVVVRLT